MSNHITIELCAEDRARLDRLADALERKACDKCVATALEFSKLRIAPEPEEDPVAEAAKKALGLTDTEESPVAPQEEPKEESGATAPPEEETPKETEPAAPTNEKTVDRAELRAKVIELSAKGLKEQTKEIVRAYAQTVTAVPDDKVTECYNALVALGG